MEPKGVFHDGFTVMGIQERVNPDDPSFYHTLWMDRYMPYDEQVKPFSTDKAYYSVYFALDNVEFCLDGMAVVAGSPIPEGLVVREIPAGRYATFECTVKTIGPTWGHIIGEWLPESPLESVPGGSSFEYYPPNTETGESLVIIYLPVRDKTS
jgi:predicted transcriptional regulator YdeE